MEVVRKSGLNWLMVLLLVLPTLGTLGAVVCTPAIADCAPMVMCPMPRGHGHAACCRCRLQPAPQLTMTSLPQALPPSMVAVANPAADPSWPCSAAAFSRRAGFATLPYHPPRPLPALA